MRALRGLLVNKGRLNQSSSTVYVRVSILERCRRVRSQVFLSPLEGRGGGGEGVRGATQLPFHKLGTVLITSEELRYRLST